MTLNIWITELLSGLAFIISIVSPIWVGYYFNTKFEIYKKTSEKKFESYSELINFARPFLSDPWITNFNEARELSLNFFQKYNNEILPFAPREVVYSVQNFLFNSWTKYANTGIQLDAFNKMIDAIRKDLWLQPLDWKEVEFHTLNEDGLKKTYKI